MFLSRHLVGSLIASAVVAGLTYSHASPGKLLSRLATGAGLFFLAAILAAASAIALLFGFFSAVADLDHLVRPAIITALIGFLLTILSAFQGTRLFRRPFGQGWKVHDD